MPNISFIKKINNTYITQNWEPCLVPFLFLYIIHDIYMKNLNNYIVEKLHLNKDIKVKEYNYHPKDKYELEYLIKNLIKERGSNADLNDIDTNEITDMSYLFKDLDPHKINISKWDVSKVKTMYKMFYECENFNSDLSNWDVSNVTNMAGMFLNCKKFNSDLSKWNVSNVKNMENMFYVCKNFNSDLSNWDVSNVTNMAGMFDRCENFNSDLSKWNVSNVKDMIDIFYGCDSLKNKPIWYKKLYKK